MKKHTEYTGRLRFLIVLVATSLPACAPPLILQHELEETSWTGEVVRAHFEKRGEHVLGSIGSRRSGIGARARFMLRLERSDAEMEPELLVRLPAELQSSCSVPGECEAVLIIRTPTSQIILDVSQGELTAFYGRSGTLLLSGKASFKRQGRDDLPWHLTLAETVLTEQPQLGDELLSWIFVGRSTVLSRWKEEWVAWPYD